MSQLRNLLSVHLPLPFGLPAMKLFYSKRYWKEVCPENIENFLLIQILIQIMAWTLSSSILQLNFDSFQSDIRKITDQNMRVKCHARVSFYQGWRFIRFYFKWVYGYDPETKAQSSNGLHPGYHEYIPRGTTIIEETDQGNFTTLYQVNTSWIIAGKRWLDVPSW